MTTILEAFDAISGKFDCELLVAGSQGMHLNIPKGKFLGGMRYEDLPYFYQSGDIFCLPSTEETAPTSILEAMACGLPVISTPVGGIEEIVEDGKTGIIIPPRESNVLANALVTLIEDGAKRARMGRGARKKAINFGWDKKAKSFMEVHEEILEQNVKTIL